MEESPSWTSRMRARNRLSFAEPLECRRLLSHAVQSVEIDTPGDDHDVSIPASALPADLIAGLNHHYPGARLLDTSFSQDDGPEFSLAIQLSGEKVEVTLNPRGQVTGVERMILADALPHEVIDWVHESFPGAQIGDATIADDAGIVSYGVLIITRAGKQLDATVWLGNGKSNVRGLPDEQTPARLDRLASEVPAAAAGIWSSTPVILQDGVASNSPTEAMPDKAANGALTCRACEEPIALEPGEAELPPADENGTPAIVALLANLAAMPASLAGALQAFTAGATPVPWSPPLSGLLNAVVPGNWSSIERGFAEILQRVDALAQNVAGDAVQNPLPARIAVGSLLLGGALLLRHPRKTRRSPVLTNNAANSSWSWILGSSAKK